MVQNNVIEKFSLRVYIRKQRSAGRRRPRRSRPQTSKQSFKFYVIRLKHLMMIITDHTINDWSYYIYQYLYYYQY